MPILSRLIRTPRRANFLPRLARDTRGAALVEAALAFPLLISLFFGISEFGEALTVSRRVEAAAGTGADLVARVRTISNADLVQVKPMLDEMIRPFPTATLGLVITSLVSDADNNTTVAWSYAEGGGAAQRTTGSSMSVPAGLTTPGQSIIVAEVTYTFRSTLTTLIVGDLPMNAEAYVKPRLVTVIEKTD
jgi:Flp pilus assembly protein TadG